MASPTNQTRPATRALLALVAILGLLATTTSVAQAQQTDETQLEAREAALIDEIAKSKQAIDELVVERSQVLVDIDSTTAAIEGSADALEQLALARRQPALVRINVALERFVNGEPAQQAFTRELRALEHDGGPLQQQQVYGSIVDAAEAEIERIDTSIRSLATTVPELQAGRIALVSMRSISASAASTIDP